MMTAPTVAAPPPTGASPGQPAGNGLLPGEVGKASAYYDATGRRHRADRPVPVNQSGRLIGIEFECRRRKCGGRRWFPIGVKDVPACQGCHHRMVEVKVKPPAPLPWRELWGAVERPLRPVWALPAMAAVGVVVDAAPVPPLVLVGAALPVGELARRAAEWQLSRFAVARGRLVEDDPDADKRLRKAIARQSRSVGYGAVAGLGWLGLAAATGLDPHTALGRVALAAGAVLWLVPAATWWWRDRNPRQRPAAVAAPAVEDAPTVAAVLVDPDEAECRRIWNTIVAVKRGPIVGKDEDGKPVPATRAGKLAETRMEDWRKVAGGCAWTAVSPPGLYVADNFVAARPAIASAYRMKTSMITCIPDPDDETRALYLAQRNSPIQDSPRWAGPDTIDVERGVAPIAVYADGDQAMYEIYRPGWGCPHVGVFGTTGCAKSELLNQIFTIDRWAHYVDDQGVAHGIVADFLIDPQQGQSFAPFLDELAAPVACSLEEAMLLVEALTAEALRRNRYLAREAKTWDPKRKKWRTGRKWWNPLVDGPILALTIDEAHDYLAHKPFATLVTKAGRMWRKCGLQVRIATHTPLLTDLGGSMALRDMLTGGFVWVGRTANSLSGPTAFNGRLPVDPRTIPALPGVAYILTGAQPKPMLARTMWEPDYYDWIRDVDDQPIGYPAVLPQVTSDTFGPEYAQWAATCGGGGLWTPSEPSRSVPQPDLRSQDAVLSVLAEAAGPLDMDGLDAALQARTGRSVPTRTVRDALKKLRDQGLVSSADGRHGLTPQAREEAVLVGEAA